MRFPRLAAMAALLLVASCSQEAPQPSVVQVVVDQVTREPYQPRSSYVGRLEAQDDVTIRAKVSGYVAKRAFREGELVEAGSVLYTLEDSEYRAALARAKAEYAAAAAGQANALRNYNRGKELLPRGAISQSEMDNLTAKKLDADAHIESAKAQITSAEVNLSYTVIKAPITGRIGRSKVSLGDLVGPSSGDLASLVSIDPIEALFQVSEATYVATVGQHLGAELDPALLRSVEVSLELTNGLTYPEVGKIDYFSNRIDTATGTMEARASIPNPHSLLVPGQYVRVILKDTNLLEGLFLPQAAVQVDQQGSFVLIVNPGGVVERRNVELGGRFEQQVMVHQGVDEGDQVIVRGLQQVRPGMPVKVKPVAAPGEDAASATKGS